MNSNSFQLEGRVTVIKPTEKISDKFQKREFVVMSQDKYPQPICLQLTQDKCTMIDAVKEGDKISVNFSLRGREWSGKDGITKYFNTLEAWRVNILEAAPTAPGAPKPSRMNIDNTPLAEPDDLPF